MYGRERAVWNVEWLVFLSGGIETIPNPVQSQSRELFATACVLVRASRRFMVLMRNAPT